MTYTVYAYNPFTETVSLRITDTLPQYGSGPIFQYDSTPAQPNPPTLVSANGKVIAWDTPPIQAWGVYSFSFRALVSSGVYTRLIGDLPAGAFGWVTFTLNIPANLPAEFLTITNTAQIGAQPPKEMPDAFEQPTSNNTSTDIDTVRGADLVVTNLTYAPARLPQGGLLTVWVTLENRGPGPTRGPDGKGWFGTDLYIKPAGVQWLYAQVDTFWKQNGDPDPLYGSSQHGRIIEGLEMDNIFGPVPIYVNPNLYLPLVVRDYRH